MEDTLQLASEEVKAEFDADRTESVFQADSFKLNSIFAGRNDLSAQAHLPGLSIDTNSTPVIEKSSDVVLGPTKPFDETDRQALVDFFRVAFATPGFDANAHYAFVGAIGQVFDRGGKEAIDKFVKDINAGLPKGMQLESRQLPPDKLKYYDEFATRNGLSKMDYAAQYVLSKNGKQVAHGMDVVLFPLRSM